MKIKNCHPEPKAKDLYQLSWNKPSEELPVSKCCGKNTFSSKHF